ncbi:MAG: addiction module protein [Deltaproteobacteria bacterium]|nr:addiction module protein [Deltaproteobacteria bacterium]
MATSDGDSVLQHALDLPPWERARLAAALLASLDEHEDADAEKAWAAQIERRAGRVLSGESRGVPWEDVRARLMARLQRR